MFSNTSQLEQFLKLEKTQADLEKKLNNPALHKSSREYAQTVRRHHELTKLLNVWRNLNKVDEELMGAKELLSDSNQDLRELALLDIESLNKEKAKLEKKLKILLIPKDSNDYKNTLLEIRAGTGGDEAALFASDLMRMYIHYAERKGWTTTILSSNETPEHGFKEVIILVEGDNVYSRLKHESGVHRVQRIPDTESFSKVHTSAVTVAVLPEAEDVEIEIKPEELRVDVFRSSGPGGQSVNTTDSAVRITHIPSGIVVICQDEKSQLKNKHQAMLVLRARLLDLKNRQQQKQISDDRREQVGSGDRSQRIRTYNYQQNRVTDHRINLTLYRLLNILDGDLDELIDKLMSFFHAQKLSEGRMEKLK
ncbi:MAG: peptide chain release factor 1 [Deltaproteobacteria bacterium]|jgi:peptide chain release factor 1|nr:peptide chain release factor 1 [Deltaproteobacteria bacterium]